jgi:hypothetical protein
VRRIVAIFDLSFAPARNKLDAVNNLIAFKELNVVLVASNAHLLLGKGGRHGILVPIDGD